VRRLALLLACVAASATAQVRPQPGAGDPHLQSIDYNSGQIVQLYGAPGYEMTLELSPDEQVQNVALGDPGAWQVSVDHSGDRLFLKPAAANIATNMTVITSVRVYNFDLVALAEPAADMPYTVHFRYPAPPAKPSGFVDVSQLRRSLSRYKISGDKWLRPDSVSDDGEHTYISWSREKPIPAVYAIGDSGQEVLANGAMRDDVYVVDGVPGRLDFRIDNHLARAVRLPPKMAGR
jgi:type IV secretion system protein VirB9